MHIHSNPNWPAFLRISVPVSHSNLSVTNRTQAKIRHTRSKTATSPECLLKLRDAKTEAKMVSEWKFSRQKLLRSLIFPGSALVLHNERRLNLRFCTLHSRLCTCTSMLPKAQENGDADPLTRVSRSPLASACCLSSSPRTKL